MIRNGRIMTRQTGSLFRNTRFMNRKTGSLFRNTKFMNRKTGSLFRNTRFMNRKTGSLFRNIRFMIRLTGSLTSSGTVYLTTRNGTPQTTFCRVKFLTPRPGIHSKQYKQQKKVERAHQRKVNWDKYQKSILFTYCLKNLTCQSYLVFCYQRLEVRVLKFNAEILAWLRLYYTKKHILMV